MAELKSPIRHLIPVEYEESGNSDAMNRAVTIPRADRGATGRPGGESLSESSGNRRGTKGRQAAIMSDFKRRRFSDSENIYFLRVLSEFLLWYLDQWVTRV